MPGCDTSDGQELVIDELDPLVLVAGAVVLPGVAVVLEDLRRRFFLCGVAGAVDAALLPESEGVAAGAGAGAGAGDEPVLPWPMTAPENMHRAPSNTPTRIERRLCSDFIVSLPENGEPAAGSLRLQQLRAGYGRTGRYVDIGRGTNGLSARSH